MKVFNRFGGVHGAGKKYDGSVENLHMNHNSCFAEGINIDNKIAWYMFATYFCAKVEMSSGLISNPKVRLTNKSLNCNDGVEYVFF